RDDCAASTADLSARFWDAGYELFGEGDSIFWDGYQALAAKLADGLKIRLNCPVQRVIYDGQGPEAVRLVTAQGEVTGAAALITLPLGVLKAGSVDFSPALPDRKLEAIQRLGVGCLSKLVFTFDEVFWPKN